MDSRIQKILDDIYRVAPELKDREIEISDIISEMLRSVPNMKPDKDFIEKLRLNLGVRIQEATDKAPAAVFGAEQSFKALLFPAMAVCAIVLLIVGSAVISNNIFNNSKTSGDRIALFSKPDITVLGENAFGVLNSFSNQSNSTVDESVSKSLTPGLGIGGGGSSEGGGNVDIMPPYTPVQYVYVYRGEDFLQDEAKMNVLRRVTQDSWGNGLGGALQEMNFNIFDMSSFDNLGVSGMNITEGRDFGYNIGIDFTRGTVNMYKDWQKWPNYYENCSDDNCYNNLRLKLSDLPDEQVITGKTGEFLSSHGIDASLYGAPQIDKDLYVYVQEGESYVSDEISVVYPLRVNGMDVYESYGGMYGLMIGYDVRSEKVSSVSNLMTQNYQSSLYDVETDVKNIIAAAESAGRDVYAENAEIGDKIEVELGTPTLAYAKYWQYVDSEEKEYLVPAFVFPIKNEANGLYRKNIVIPLVKGFLEQYYGPLMKSSETTG